MNSGGTTLIKLIFAIWEILLCVVILYMTLLDRNELKKFEFLLWPVVSAVLGLSVYKKELFFPSYVTVFATVFMISIIVSLIKKVSFHKILVVVWTYISAFSFIHIYVSFMNISYVLEDVTKGNYMTSLNMSKTVVYCLICVLLTFGLIVIKEYRERVETYIFKYGNIFLMMDMAFFVMLVFGRKFLFRFAMEAQPVEVMEVIKFAGLGLLIVVVMFVMIRYEVLKIDYSTLQLRDEMTMKNYEELSEVYMNNRQIIHDIKNHLLIIKEYGKAGELEKMNRYVDDISKNYIEVKLEQWTGNQILDFILSQKKEQAEQKGIELIISASPILKFNISESDICAVFANLLDNAIEAAEQVQDQKKWIKVTIHEKKEMIFIKVENNYCKDPVMKNGDYITTKKEKSVHGYGLKSVKRIVHKHDGMITCQAENKVFTVKISFFNMDDEKGYE